MLVHVPVCQNTDFLSDYFQWVPESTVMSNQSLMFFGRNYKVGR